MSRRLFRKRNDKIATGLIAGLADYTNMGVDLLRIIFAVMVLAHPPIFLVYLLVSVFVPVEGRSERKTKPHPRGYGRIKEAEKVKSEQKWDDF